MTDRTDTMTSIITQRDQAVAAINATQAQLRAKAEQIKDQAAYEGPLSTSDADTIGKIYSVMGSLSATENELMIVSLRSLNEAPEVKRLANVVAAMNSDLDAKLASISRLIATIAEAGKIVSEVDGVLQGLMRLATLL